MLSKLRPHTCLPTADSERKLRDKNVFGGVQFWGANWNHRKAFLFRDLLESVTPLASASGTTGRCGRKLDQLFCATIRGGLCWHGRSSVWTNTASFCTDVVTICPTEFGSEVATQKTYLVVTDDSKKTLTNVCDKNKRKTAPKSTNESQCHVSMASRVNIADVADEDWICAFVTAEPNIWFFL